MTYYRDKPISREDALRKARIYSELAIATFERMNTPDTRLWANYERKNLEVLN